MDNNIILSLRIEDLPIKKPDKVFFKKHGVVYLGEFFAFERAHWREFRQSHCAKAVPRMIEILNKLGYDKNTDPAWTPPYFSDLKWLSIILNTPTMEGFHTPEEAARLHAKGQHCLGQALCDMEGQINETIHRKNFQSSLSDRSKKMGVHAWMIIPSQWKAPKRPPLCWTKYLREMAKAQEDWQPEEPQAPRPPRFEDLLYPVTYLEISVRTGKLLKNAGIQLIGDLVQISEDALTKSIQRHGLGFGRKSVKELKEVLENMRFTLDMPPEHPLIIQFEAVQAEQKNPE